MTVSATFASTALRLAHAVADHLAAAELHLLAVDREVLLDLDEELGVGEAHAVAGGGAEHLGIGLPRDIFIASLPVRERPIGPAFSATAAGFLAGAGAFFAPASAPITCPLKP